MPLLPLEPVLHPDELKSGNIIYPYSAALK